MQHCKLSHEVLMIVSALGLSSGVLAQSIDVPATSEWPSVTSFPIPAGSILVVESSGLWHSGSFHGGPDGDGVPPGGGFIAPDLYAYALIGKLDGVGVNLPIYSRYIGQALAGGYLHLTMNDVPGIFWDNSGEVTATVGYCQTWEERQVPADVMWGTTSYTLEVGQKLVIKAEGTWTTGSWTGDADGYGSSGGGNHILPNDSAYGLIARIGNGTPFFVGSEYIGVASAAGPLRLGMNDVPGIFWDNSGALTVTVGLVDPFLDCNGNGIPDSQDLANGTSPDSNGNGIPDECECGATNYCEVSPNSAGPGAVIGYQGSLKISDGNFRLHATGAPANQFGLFFYGTTQAQAPFGNGVRCVGGALRRLPAGPTGPMGTPSCLVTFDTPATSDLVPFTEYYFQLWTRDPAAGGSGFNTSDGLAVTLCP